MSNLTLVDLRPDRKLLDPNFSGYKLSLDKIPIYKKELESGVGVSSPSSGQFSFLHTKLFSLHNHLYCNPHEPEKVFYVDPGYIVKEISLGVPNRINVNEVWKIPEGGKDVGEYNLSVVFANRTIVVVSDGRGKVHIVDCSKEQWEGMACQEVGKGVVTAAALNDDMLSLVLLSVEEKEEKDEGKQGSFESVLDWVELKKDKENWSMKSERRVISGGSVDYVEFETGGKALYLVTDKEPHFIHDSVNPVREPLHEPSNSTPKSYLWSQSDFFINLTFPIPEGTEKNEVEVNITSCTIEVRVRSTLLLRGDFVHAVDVDMSEWLLQEGKLAVHLVKVEKDVEWVSVVVGDLSGEMVLDANTVAEVHERLAHLCSDKVEEPSSGSCFNSAQLEDCDSALDNTTSYIRLDSITHSITHKVNSIQWLFKLNWDASKPAAVCARDDVDVCVWQFTPAQDKLWPAQHVATFLAFGYVQASKTQKKFLVGPPDCSYVAVCDVSSHIYLYRQPSPVEGDLRNRVTGRLVGSVARQQLVSLEDREEILGVHTTHANMFVLTPNTIHVLVIN